VTDIFEKGGEAVLELLKTQGIPAVTSALGDLSKSATEEWQKSLLKLGVALVSDHGPDGLNLLEDMVSRLQSGKTVDLSKLTLEEASSLLAVMQRKEADTKNQVALYTQIVIETIGKGLSILISVLFQSIKL